MQVNSDFDDIVVGRVASSGFQVYNGVHVTPKLRRRKKLHVTSYKLQVTSDKLQAPP
jgi:hypothetical protein